MWGRPTTLAPCLMVLPPAHAEHVRKAHRKIQPFFCPVPPQWVHLILEWSGSEITYPTARTAQMTKRAAL